MIQVHSIYPGVDHLTDAMGVCMTLLQGRNRALLFDTGYGTENVREAVLPLIGGKPLTVLLSHGHHDHILGARWFDRVSLCAEDFPEYRLRTSPAQRERVADQAKAKGIPLPDDWLTAPCPEPDPLPLPEVTAGFPSRTENLGGLTLRIIQVPGHTPGSLMIYIPRFRLLLTGDNWNPCTWLWFPSSVSAPLWRENMLRLMNALPFRHVLCSHQPSLYPAEAPRRFVASLTPSRLAEAVPVPLDPVIDTRQATPDGEGMTFVFDYGKAVNESSSQNR